MYINRCVLLYCRKIPVGIGFEASCILCFKLWNSRHGWDDQSAYIERRQVPACSSPQCTVLMAIACPLVELYMLVLQSRCTCIAFNLLFWTVEELFFWTLESTQTIFCVLSYLLFDGYMIFWKWKKKEKRKEKNKPTKNSRR